MFSERASAQVPECSLSSFRFEDCFFSFFRFVRTHALRKNCPYLELSWSAFLPHFTAFGLNTESYSVSLHIQLECGKMREKCGPE